MGKYIYNSTSYSKLTFRFYHATSFIAYTHKLCNAIEAYGLTEAENSHRAVDDARATVLLLEAVAAEKDDLMRYIDLFGTHPKYGLSGKKISSVTYCPQPYDRRVPLYELTHTM